jgi:tetratricopeptide (TPR) repeat protein
MTEQLPCADLQKLKSFSLGQLGEPEAEALERHVSQCPRCGKRLGELEAEDSLVLAMRKPSSILQGPDQGTVRDLVARLRGLPAIATPVGEATVLEKPASDAIPPGPYDFLAPAEAPGELGRLGPYRVTRVLGQGGMGVVFEADDLLLKRKVALKVILDARYAEPRYVARFRGEAEAVARLTHPNIVTIYEVGDQRGRPYLAFEYVEGGNLADRLGGQPQPVAVSAGLVETLARAVHHAHQQGVIHRDLKPANILLSVGQAFQPDASPGVRLESLTYKITDFGLARRLDNEGMTQTGELLGTPGYMTPELTRGHGPAADSGPRVDVYSLGAILYELLTGRPPFRGESVVDTLEQARTLDPVPPRRLRPGIPRDLETVCLKCLHREPARRYATALALADDLGRFLCGEPIHARPAGALERLRKWAQRKPALAGLVAVSGLAVVVLVVGVLWHNGRLRTEVQRAEAAEKRAEANYQRARDTVSRMLQRLDDRRWARVPQLYELKKEQTEDALAFYKAIVREEDEQDPTVQLDVALAYFKAGIIECALSRFDDAGQSFGQARLRFERLAGADPDNLDYQRRLARCWNHLGHLHILRRGPGDDPLHCYQEALAITERMARAHPEDPDLRSYVLTVSHNVANALFAAGRLSEARSRREKTLALARELVRDHPAVAEWDLAAALVNLGESHLADGQATKAEAAFREGEALFARLHREQPENLTLACNLVETYGDRVWVMLGTGRAPAAIELCTRAIGLAEDYQRREPLSTETNEILSRLCMLRALAYGLAGDEAKASADWSRAAVVAEKTSNVLARLNGTLALAHLGNYDQAAARVGPAGPAEQLFHQALVYAACARAAGKDKRLPAPERARRAERYAAEALKLLGQAQAAGMLRNPAYVTLLRQGPSFEALRARADFEKLLRKMKEGLPGKP